MWHKCPISGPTIFNTPCGSFRMVISPNPAKETINLIIEEREATKSPKTNKTPFKATVALYNDNNILVRRLTSNNKRITINRGGLFPGQIYRSGNYRDRKTVESNNN